MSSEEESFYPDPPEVTGRTFWDALSGKGLIILSLIALAVCAVLIVLYRDSIDWKAILEILKEHWYVALAPVAGWILGRSAAKLLHSPSGRIVISVDPGTHTARVVMIPEELFRFLNQSGNNVVYHSPVGLPVYLAKSIDLQSMSIDYGWVHEHDPLIVMTRENSYQSWKDTLDRVMKDNLRLMDTPHVLGLQYAGKSLKKHLDRLSRAVGVEDQPEGPDEYDPMRPNDEIVEVDDEQSDRLHL